MRNRTESLSRIHEKVRQIELNVKSSQYRRVIHSSGGNRLYTSQTAKVKCHRDVCHRGMPHSAKGMFIVAILPFNRNGS
jgi:hypothetical protein